MPNKILPSGQVEMRDSSSAATVAAGALRLLIVHPARVPYFLHCFSVCFSSVIHGVVHRLRICADTPCSNQMQCL